jgi:hypothetical protein
MVTVLLPVYNGAGYLDAALASILGQSFKDFELLIIDDGSTDRTPEIIEACQDKRIRCIRHESNRGLIATLNEGLGLTASKYVARMDADDVCHPQRLEMQHRFMEEHPDVGVAGTAIRLIDREGRRGPTYRFPEQHDVILWALSFVCPMAHPTVMMRRDLVVSAGGYSVSAVHAEDYDLWERLSTRTRFANLPQALLSLRKHELSVTSQEAVRHVATVTSISTRCMSNRLGHPVNGAVATCLMRIAPCRAEQIFEATRVLLELYESFQTESEAARMIVRRDTALRLALLALRGASGRSRLWLSWRATRIDPYGWICLGRRVLGRFTGLGEQRLVG